MFTNNNNLKHGLESVGIDFAKVSDLLAYDTNGRPLTGIALNNKAAKAANPYVFVNRLNDGGILIVAKNHKGDEFIFNTSKDGDTVPAPRFNAPQARRKKPKSNLFARAAEAWTNAGGVVESHPYTTKKAVCVTGANLRRGGFDLVAGGFDYRDCLILRLVDISGNLRGFQFIAADGQKRYLLAEEGGKNGAFAIIGDADDIKKGAFVVEGLATGLSVYHAGGDGKTTLNNAKKWPVIVALDASNLLPVFDVLKNRYGVKKLSLCADNDTKESGNAGRFYAAQVCQSVGLSSYYLPIGNDGGLNAKLDFNDTLRFKKIAAPVDRVGYALALVDFCPLQSINKTAKAAALALADTAPAKQTIDEAKKVLELRLLARGVDMATITRAANLIAWHVEKRKEKLFKLNRAGGDLVRFNTTGLINPRIDSSLPMDGHAICDARGMASGKTELMGLRMKDLDACAYITHRVSLVDDACNRLGLTHYHENDRYADRVAVCINSLIKFAIAVEGKPLFIDEARQTLETVINSPTIDGRQLLLDVFIRILNDCPALHLADADLNAETIAFFKEHCPRLNFVLVETDTAPHEAKHVILPSFDAAKSSILDDLLSGKRGMIGATSEKQARYLHNFLVKSGVSSSKILLLTSKNKDDGKQAALLANVSKEAGKYDAIIYTSVLGSGVSVVVPDFEFTYFLCSNVLPSNESLQMLARNRCAKRVFVAFERQHSISRVIDIDVIKSGQIKKVSDFAANFGIETKSTLNTLGLMQCSMVARLNDDLNDMAGNFLLLADIAGRHFERLNFEVDAVTVETIKKTNKETKEQIRNDILNAQTLCQVELNRLKKKSAITQAESDAVARAEVVEMVGSSKITLEDVRNHEKGYHKRLKNYLLLSADTETLKQRDFDNFQAKNSLRYLTSRQKIFRAVLAPLVAAGDRITANDFQKACAVLKKYHEELASDFGRYDKPVFDRAGKTVAYFLEKIGIEITEVSKNNSDRFFALKLNEEIGRYVSNRAGCSHFFNGR